MKIAAEAIRQVGKDREEEDVLFTWEEMKGWGMALNLNMKWEAR